MILNFAATTRRVDIASLLGPASSTGPVLLASTGGTGGCDGPEPTVTLAPFSGAVLDPGPPLPIAKS